MKKRSRISRRAFLVTASMTFAGLGTRAWGFPPQSAPPRRLQVGGNALFHVPANFVGLSYESMQLEDATFFSPANVSLVEQFRKITSNGVLRLGGNTSEFSWWKATPETEAPHRLASPFDHEGEPAAATMFAITPEAIDNLDGFLKATGWRCIYGLNLGYGTPAIDLLEARYVADRLGDRLEYFQVGNEVDLFKRHLRDPATWNVDAYLKEWLAVAQAVQKALPKVKFGLPDVASDVSWLTAIADRWSALENKPQVISMSHHYYWSGPPSNPKASIENLLQSDPGVLAKAKLARNASEKLGRGVTWRMTEGNTIYQGGKWGVSDVFAAALWSADYLLTLMSAGYAGVNLHGGSGHAQAVSVGGVFHGEALMPDPNAPHPKPFYTPIANRGTLAGSGVDGQLDSTYVLEPCGYGMKFAAAFAGTTLLDVSIDVGDVNAKAWAARRADGAVIVVVINKDASKSLSMECAPFDLEAEMTSPALNSRNVTFTMGKAAASARLQPQPGRLTVPPHTAVLIRLRKA